MIANMNQKKRPVNAVVRTLEDVPLNKKRKLILGSYMIKLFPGRAKKLSENKLDNYLGAFDRLLRNGLTAEAFASGDHAKQRALFSHYWFEEADGEASLWEDRFKDEFLGNNVVLIDELVKLLTHQKFDQLYEIGCGYGQVTEYLANRFGEIDKFVGIDISSEQIQKNQARCQNENITYIAADAVDWVLGEAQPNSIFLTNGGVLEYFLQKELEDIFQHVAQNLKPAVFGVIETIGADHDIENEKNSLLYGRELAFSHNYPHLLEKAGFKVVYHKERTGTPQHGGGRWILVLATA